MKPIALPNAQQSMCSNDDLRCTLDTAGLTRTPSTVHTRHCAVIPGPRRVIAMLSVLGCLALGAQDHAAAQIVIGTPSQIAAYQLRNQLREVFDAGRELIAAKAQFNTALANARRDFFVEYPSGSRRSEAEARFSTLLAQKDLHFLVNSILIDFAGPRSRDMVQGLDKLTGGEIDGGIPRAARDAFETWVATVKGNVKPRGTLSAAAVDAAILASDGEYRTYKTVRDRVELERQCLSNPKPYCSSAAAPGEPTVSYKGANNFRMIIDYGPVPDSFVPPLPNLPEGTLENNKKAIEIEMKKLTPGVLVAVHLHKFAPVDAFSGFQMHSPEYAIYDEDTRAIWREKGVTLSCVYRHRSGGVVSEHYWFRVMPASAEPEKLQARLPNHPILRAFKGTATSCPAHQSS